MVKFIYFIISVTLCVFLILLSGKIIGDIDFAVKAPYIEDFQDEKAVSELKHERDMHNSEIDSLNLKKDSIERTMNLARSNYDNEKASFENWLATRKTVGLPEKDKEVIDRANKLDSFYAIEQAWRQKIYEIQTQIDEIEAKRGKITSSINEYDAKAREKYYAALDFHKLKVFLVRLLFTLPILALGVFFFIRFRKHKFAPIFIGFSLFSVYTFFFGLLPYLPSYGGYVRYSVGVILTLWLGYYAIKYIRTYAEKKQAELAASAQERAKKVHNDTAEKALDNHFCPSCNKDFIMKNWEIAAAPKGSLAITDFCRHCGMELFKKCDKCGERNFAHLPFCSSCGSKITIK